MGQVASSQLARVNAATLGLCTGKQISECGKKILEDTSVTELTVRSSSHDCKLVNDFVLPQPMTSGGVECVDDRIRNLVFLTCPGPISCMFVPLSNFAAEDNITCCSHP